jgi:hypothetical protein
MQNYSESFEDNHPQKLSLACWLGWGFTLESTEAFLLSDNQSIQMQKGAILS